MLTRLTACACAVMLCPLTSGTVLKAAETGSTGRPNIILILADDLGYGEVGVYGQSRILTPNIDRMAHEGIRFNRFYAGAPFGSASRCVLMTGQHAGQTRIRGNVRPEDEDKQELLDEDITIAEVLHAAGYRTALIGKWGLGADRSSGHPNNQGFDTFFGYLSAYHAHNHYPTFLWRNHEQVLLPNSGAPTDPAAASGAGATPQHEAYAPDLFAEEALRFIDENKDRPFFLYYPTNVPHSNNEAAAVNRADGAEVPDLGVYEKRPWGLGAKRHAAMITRMDHDIGRILDKLDELGIAENTLVIFSSDNGPHRDHVDPNNFFQPSGPLRGYKGYLWEGGIRVPMIIRWPAKIAPGQVSEHVGYLGDLMATFADIARQPLPEPSHTISLVPLLTGDLDKQQKHHWLYWENPDQDVGVAALLDGRWKGILRTRGDPSLTIYDIENDIEERYTLIDERDDLAAVFQEFFNTARIPNPDWPMPE